MSKSLFNSETHSTLLLVALASSAHVLGPAVSVLCADTVVKRSAVALADRGCKCILNTDYVALKESSDMIMCFARSI